MITGFPKIFSLNTTYIKDIFEDEVEIQEKLDGSHMAFGKKDGDLQVRSKGAQLYFDHPEKMFIEGVDYIKSIEDDIPDDMTFYAEYLKKPKHNTLQYDHIPKNHLMLFAVKFDDETFGDDVILKHYAKLFDIDKAPLLFKGFIHNIALIHEFLELDSYLGGPKIEGVVVKNFDKPFLLGGQPIPIMAGKLVSEKFKEVHGKAWKLGSSKSKLEMFFESYQTEARWAKTIQHQKEKGLLSQPGPRDIGGLLKEIHSDIMEEEKENIKKFLWDHFRKDLLRTATRGFVDWYKKQLMEGKV